MFNSYICIALPQKWIVQRKKLNWNTTSEKQMKQNTQFCWGGSFGATETVTISPGDARWVGAWWLGYLIAGTLTLMSAVPFWFLPKSLPMPVDKHDSSCSAEQTRFLKDSPTKEHKFRPEEPANLYQMAKGRIILPSSHICHFMWCKNFE